MKIERKQGSVVTLETAKGVKKEFEIEHAERLLRHPNSGWKLPEDSSYQFEYYDGITKRTDTGDSGEAAKGGNNT